VEDKLLQKNVALTDEELAIIHKLAKAENVLQFNSRSDEVDELSLELR
jgi:hypothetical protein